MGHDHDLWSLDGERTILTVHLTLDRAVTQDIACRVKGEANEAMGTLGIDHCTLEIAGPGEPCDRR